MADDTHPHADLNLHSEDGFFPIRISSLRVDTVTDFDLYIRQHGGEFPILYRKRDLPFDEGVRERLRANRVEQLYVSDTQDKEYRQYVERNLQGILDDPHIDMSERSAVLYSCSMEVVKEILEDPRAGDVVARSENLVANAASFLFTKTGSFEQLLKVTSFDYYTYTHCVNVFVFSISLAKKMGYSEEKALRLGNGALLHDIGKCTIDPEIVNSRNKLTPEQWEQMKKHPAAGCELLQLHGVSDEIQLDVVRHHHEKLSGKGYPDALGPNDISPEARISAIADIFDALTTKRSYKTAIGSFPALRLMKDEMSSDLDAEIFRVFVSMMGNPGSA